MNDIHPKSIPAAALREFLDQGFRVELESAWDHSEQLTFGRTTESGDFAEFFSILIRSSGTFIAFHDDRSVYRVGRCERLWELCDALLRAPVALADGDDSAMVRIVRIFLLERVDPHWIAEEGRVRRAELIREMGWLELLGDEDSRLWDRVIERLGILITSGPHAPRIREPPPSMTWHVPLRTDVWRRDIMTAKVREYRTGINSRILECLRSNVRKGEDVYCLDYNHPCYRIDPSDERVGLFVAWWPICPLPADDFFLFVVNDLSAGIFTDPYEASICAFGRDMARCLEKSLAPYKLNLLRKREG